MRIFFMRTDVRICMLPVSNSVTWNGARCIHKTSPRMAADTLVREGDYVVVDENGEKKSIQMIRAGR